jgi:hypothetical protein
VSTPRDAPAESVQRLLAPVAHDGAPVPTLFPAPALPGDFPAPRRHPGVPLALPRSVLAPTVAANAPRVGLVRLARPVRPRDSLLRTPGRGPAAPARQHSRPTPSRPGSGTQGRHTSWWPAYTWSAAGSPCHSTRPGSVGHTGHRPRTRPAARALRGALLTRRHCCGCRPSAGASRPSVPS